MRKKMIGPSGIYGTGNVVDESEGAELRLVQPDSGRWAVHYIPATTEIEHAVSLDDRFALARSPILLVEGDLLTGIVTTYPLHER
jgi:hypothetical protein